jgi:hypothetical protein
MGLKHKIVVVFILILTQLFYCSYKSFAQGVTNPFGRIITNGTYYITGQNNDTTDIIDTICLGDILTYEYYIGNAKSIDSLYLVFDNNDTIWGVKGEYRFNDTVGLFLITSVAWLTDYYGTSYQSFVDASIVYIKYCPPPSLWPYPTVPSVKMSALILFPKQPTAPKAMHGILKEANQPFGSIKIHRLFAIKTRAHFK